MIVAAMTETMTMTATGADEIPSALHPPLAVQEMAGDGTKGHKMMGTWGFLGLCLLAVIVCILLEGCAGPSRDGPFRDDISWRILREHHQHHEWRRR